MSDAPLVFRSDGPSDTAWLGRALGDVAEPGDVLLLQGPFGAGKTVFVQGLAQGLDVAGPVTSPSFVLAVEHPGRLPLVHVDLFRLDAPEGALVAALHEYLEGEGVCAVEWSERLPLPTGLVATTVRLGVEGACTRRLEIQPARAAQRLVLAALSPAGEQR
jgi:tRNA threonylcarbamoyladenosine biosynthesis protein TsaE